MGEGLELADRASQAFDSILEDVTEVAGQVSGIAAATEEQSTTGEQIARSVDAISAVSSEAAQGVSAIARSTDELNALADEMRGLVDAFEIDTSEVGDMASAHVATGSTLTLA